MREKLYDGRVIDGAGNLSWSFQAERKCARTRAKGEYVLVRSEDEYCKYDCLLSARDSLFS